MRRLSAVLLAMVCMLAGTAPAHAYSESDLKRRIAGELRHAGPRSGVYVRDMDSGEVLYAARADRRRIPASVEKLYTTATALLRFGPEATLQTTVMTAAELDADGVLRGDLVLVGGGDPFFGGAAATRLARAVKDAGVRRVDGAIVGDESAFDALRSACCSGYDRDLGGVLSALSYEGGIFRGRARLDAARFAAGRFAAKLRAIGVLAGERSRAGTAPDGARLVAAEPSRVIADIATDINVPSNNFAAEMLLKGLGARFGAGGTRAAGATVVRTTLDEIGVRPRFVDGSGLSRSNRTSPREVVRLLERMDAPDLSETFQTTLAVAGVNGTVRKRMRATAAARRCRVKTGTLRDVSTLAGYCLARGGRKIGFALMFNGVYPPAAKRIEDRIAVAIARLTSAPAAPAFDG